MIKIVILAFDNHTRVINAIDRLYATTEIANYCHDITLFDPHYPLPENNSELLKNLPIIKYVDLERNYGQDENINKITKTLEFDHTDIIVLYDTDIAINKSGWLKDSLTIIQDGIADFITVDCYHPIAPNRGMMPISQMQGLKQTHKDITYQKLTWPGGWPIGIFSGQFFRKFKLTPSHSFYGGTENNTFNVMKKQQVEGVLLSDYVDERNQENVDGDYLEWKHHAAHNQQAPDFIEWINAKKVL